MRKIQKSALVAYTPGQMFDLVDDIDSYSEFLPWCSASQVLQRTEQEVKATLEIAYGKLNKSFSTRNVNIPSEHIQMQLIEGPFKRLQGDWHFTAMGEEGSRVSLELEFEFANKLLDMSVGPVFNKIANSLVDAFIARARTKYG